MLQVIGIESMETKEGKGGREGREEVVREEVTQRQNINYEKNDESNVVSSQQKKHLTASDWAIAIKGNITSSS